jgi:DUF4097 and DUF4098 domain-containing protein YvlB
MALPPPHDPGPLRLRVSTSSGTVTVTAEGRQDVLIEEGGEAGLPIDGVIEVRPVRPSSSVRVHCPAGSDVMIGTSSGSVRLDGRFGTASVTSSSGSIRASDVGGADLRTGSGAVEVDRCEGSCRIATKSGRVTVGHVGAAEISTVSGTISIGPVVGSTQVRSVSGEVEITSDSDGPVRARTVSGSIMILVPEGTRPNVNVSGPKVECACEHGDDMAIDVTTMSGSVEISPC